MAHLFKVKVEKAGLDLEIKKLETFLADPKYVSESMKNLMYTQLASMKNYSSSLKNRIGLFEDENPGITEIESTQMFAVKSLSH